MLDRIQQIWTQHPLRARIVVVLILAAAVLLPRLGEPMIIHSDEGHYVGATLQALEYGEWVVPLEDGEFNRHYGKPPFGHALMATSVILVGESKLSFRLPFILMAMLCLTLIVLLGERWCTNAGLFAALILLSSVGWAEHTRRIWLETLVVPLDLAGLLFYLRDRQNPRWQTLIAAAGCFAAALLTKQLAAGFGLAALITAEIVTDRRRLLRAGAIAAIACLPLALWFVLLGARVGTEAESIWSLHVIRGVFEGHGHQARHAGDYVKGIATLLGWGGAALGLGGVGLLLERSRRREHFDARTLLIYLGLSIIIIGVVSRSNRFWYSFPAAYVLALAAGLLLATLFARWRQTDGASLAAIAVAIGVAALQWYGRAHEAYLLAAGILLIVIALGIAHKIPRWLTRWCVAVILLAWVASYGLSFYRNIIQIKPDPLERWAAQLRETKVDAIVAEPSFFHEEFIHYFRDLPLQRTRRGDVCRPPPPGHRYAYVSNTQRPPACWQQLGRAQRVTFHSYVVMSQPRPP